MIRSAILAAAAAFLLAGCLAPEEEAKLLAEKNVRANLLDPDSARFGESFVVVEEPDERGWRAYNVCGQVNSRNRLGGYAGSTRYVFIYRRLEDQNVVSSRLAAIEGPTDRHAIAGSSKDEPAPSIFEHVYWNEHCVDSRHPPSYTGERAY